MTDDFRGWTPVRVTPRPGGPVTQWCYTHGFTFDDPFFGQTVERCLHNPFRLLFSRHTPMEALSELAAGPGALAPSGFVFHLSRCGSTLVTQMLASRGDTLVMSEAGPLDTVLRAAEPVERRSAWLADMVAALSRSGRADTRHFVIKFDAWAMLDFDVVARAFPETPWIFVHRDPVDVLVSQSLHRGYHMMPFALSPEAVGLTGDAVAALSLTEYGAAVLGRICARASEAAAAAGRKALFVDYTELPGAAWSRIASHFGMETSTGQLERMRRTATRDAKNPAIEFVTDRARKQQSATPEIRAAVDRWVAEPYDTLVRAGRVNR